MKCKCNISQVVDWKWWLAGPVHCGQRRSGVTFQSAATHTDTLLPITHAHKLSTYYMLTQYGYLGLPSPKTQHLISRRNSQVMHSGDHTVHTNCSQE